MNIDITGITLMTPRLILRPFCMEDAADVFAYAKDADVGPMDGWAPHKDLVESERVVRMFMDGKKTFAVVHREDGNVIGSIGIEELSLLLPGYGDHNGREIGYVLSKSYWGQGLMPEAAKEVIRYCFEEAGCEYLICSHSAANHRSKRVMEKCGFTFVCEHPRTLTNGETSMAQYHVLLK